MSDKRRTPRFHTHGTVLLQDGEAEISATVTEISETGCLLSVQAGAKLPEEFTLAAGDHSQILLPAAIKRRVNNRIVGVEFREPVRSRVGLPVEQCFHIGRRETRPEYIVPYEEDSFWLLDSLIPMCGESRPFRNIVSRFSRDKKFAAAVHWQRNVNPESSPFSSFVHRQFEAGRSAIRVHFYRMPTPASRKNIQPVDPGQWTYWGYVTVRPLRLRDDGEDFALAHVGETVLWVPECDTNAPEEGLSFVGDDILYVSGTTHYSFVDGKREAIHSAVFRQQDRVYGTCGHNAVRMSTEHLSRSLSVRVVREEEIGRELRPHSGSSIHPTDLHEDSIAKALSLSGCDVRSYFLNWYGGRSFFPRRAVSTAELENLIHFAVDSSLAPIIILHPKGENTDGRTFERHAACVVGHSGTDSADPHLPNTVGGSGSYLSATSWLRDFIIHDDSIGPFLRIPRGQTEYHDTRFPGEEFDDSGAPWVPLDQLWERTVSDDIETLIMPLPAEVANDPLDVYETAMTQLTDLLSDKIAEGVLASAGEDDLETFGELRRAARGQDLVVNFYLERSDEFRRRALCRVPEMRHEFTDEFDLISNTLLPPFIYVFTVTSRQRIEEAQSYSKAPILGYMLFDTLSPQFSTESDIVLRLGELYSVRTTAAAPEFGCTPFPLRRSFLFGGASS